MLIPVILCVLLSYSTHISAMSDDMKQMAQVVHDSCVAEIDVDEKFIEDCRKGIFTEDPKLKCYMKCLLTKVPMMTEEGNIDVEVIMSMVPQEYKAMAEPIVRGCGTVKGADDCDTAFQTNKCWHSKDPEHYYLV